MKNTAREEYKRKIRKNKLRWPRHYWRSKEGRKSKDNRHWIYSLYQDLYGKVEIIEKELRGNHNKSEYH